MIAWRGKDKEVWDTAQPEEFRDKTADTLGKEPVRGRPGRHLGQTWRRSFLATHNGRADRCAPLSSCQPLEKGLPFWRSPNPRKRALPQIPWAWFPVETAKWRESQSRERAKACCVPCAVWASHNPWSGSRPLRAGPGKRS